MLHPLPGGSISQGEVIDYTLLNRMDQIRDGALFSRNLADEHRQKIVGATEVIKEQVLYPQEDTDRPPDWETRLLKSLDEEVVAKAEFDDDTGAIVLKLLWPLVPEKKRKELEQTS